MLAKAFTFFILFQGLTTPEQYLEKLNYSIEFIQKKQDTIADKMAKLQGTYTI